MKVFGAVKMGVEECLEEFKLAAGGVDDRRGMIVRVRRTGGGG